MKKRILIVLLTITHFAFLAVGYSIAICHSQTEMTIEETTIESNPIETKESTESVAETESTTVETESVLSTENTQETQTLETGEAVTEPEVTELPNSDNSVEVDSPYLGAEMPED